MQALFETGSLRRVFLRGRPDARSQGTQPDDAGWPALLRPAQLYVVIVTLLGAAVLAALLPLTYPRPMLFAVLLVLACVTSAWKVKLPLPLVSSATLSPSEAGLERARLTIRVAHVGPHGWSGTGSTMGTADARKRHLRRARRPARRRP